MQTQSCERTNDCGYGMHTSTTCRNGSRYSKAIISPTHAKDTRVSFRNTRRAHLIGSRDFGNDALQTGLPRIALDAQFTRV